MFFFSATLTAQQFNRTIANKDLKALVGVWTGPVVNTDTAFNNALLTVQGKVEIEDMADSIGLTFAFTDANNKISIEKCSLYIYDNDQKIRIGGVEYEIESTSRRSYNLTIIAGRQGYENYKLMDFRYQIYFGPHFLNIIKEARFPYMDAYFIRSRASYTKK
jgi:hypothetical protein